MKIIITYASVGSGHFKAGQSIYNYFRQKNQDWQIQLIDILETTNFLFKTIYVRGYVFLISHALWLWSFAFCLTSVRALRPIIKGIIFLIYRLNTKKFNKFLIQSSPDYVISTHFLPSEISGYLKRNQKIKSKLLTVITDFGVHPFWICEGTDFYVAASDYTKEQLLIEGLPNESIKVLGIPVEQKFLEQYDRNTLLKNFGLTSDKFTILIVTGSFGIGPIEEIVDLLHKDVQILAVCARNKRLYRRLKNKDYPQVKVFGFVDNIHEFMAASDIIVTKPGGLTISEALSRESMPLFISTIAGQEAENARVLERYGAGVKIKNIRRLRDVILDYKTHPDKLIGIKEKIRKIKRADALEGLYNVVCQGSAGNTC